jgi:hypothetical protein
MNILNIGRYKFEINHDICYENINEALGVRNPYPSLWKSPEGPELLKFLNDIKEPIRALYRNVLVRSAGFSYDIAKDINCPWIKSLKLDIEFKNGVTNGWVNHKECFIENGQLISTIHINLPNDREPDEHMFESTFRHELLHLLQYRYWILLKPSEESKEILNSNSAAYYKRIKEHLIKNNKISIGNDIKFYDTTPGERICLILTFLMYKLNALETPAFIQTIYERKYQYWLDYQNTHEQKFVVKFNNEIPEQLEKLVKIINSLIEKLKPLIEYEKTNQLSKIRYEHTKEFLKNWCIGPIVRNMKIPFNSPKFFSRILREITSRYEDFKLKLYRMDTLFYAEEEQLKWDLEHDLVVKSENFKNRRFQTSIIEIEELKESDQSKFKLVQSTKNLYKNAIDLEGFLD